LAVLLVAVKSTVAERISKDCNVFYFKVDEYLDELISLAAENGFATCSKINTMTSDEVWMRSSAEQCDEEFAIYNEIDEFVFEKLNAIDEDIIIAE